MGVVEYPGYNWTTNGEVSPNVAAVLKPTLIVFAAPTGEIPEVLKEMSPPELETVPVSRFRLALERERVDVWVRSARAVSGRKNARAGNARRQRITCLAYRLPSSGG